MDYRKVTPEEKVYIHRLQSLAFNFSVSETEVREQITKGEYHSDHTYGAVTEAGQVVAGMDATPYSMWFDGRKASMVGIGGVVSAPENRRSGNVRGILRKVFDDAYESGVVFSHLYPFNFDYYRQFGYEHLGRAVKYRLPPGPARALKQTGRAAEYLSAAAPAELTQKIKDVYETFASRHNVMISRGEDKWNRLLKTTLFGGDRLYYWMDENGEPRAWVTLEKTKDQLTIKEKAWADHRAMLGILQFLGMYEGSVPKMEITPGPELAAELYWPDLYAVEAEKSFNLGMNRLLNVASALTLLKKPSSQGQVIIQVHDSFAAWNEKRFLVEYAAGEGAVSETHRSPDLELTQGILMLLVLGVYEPQLILDRQDVQTFGNQEGICELFPPKKIFIDDFF